MVAVGLATALAAALITPEISPSVESLVETVARVCATAQKPVRRELLRDLVRLEVSSGIPKYARGITLVAACRESGFRVRPRRGDSGKAAGLFQWWPWWERTYGFDRELQPMDGVAYTLLHVKGLMRKAARICGRPRAFFYAWTWVMSGPRGHRCRFNRHVRRLLKWRWISQRK